MVRNTTFGFLPLGHLRRFLARRFSPFAACLMGICAVALFGGRPLKAQLVSGGGIQGTVTDPSGAVVAKAQITATNTDTGVQLTRQSSGAGTYSIAPLQAGHYNVEVVAKGFQRLLQEDINVDTNVMYGLNLKLTVGGDNQTVTITDAPPYLDTTDATLGGTIENELYSALPLSMNGGPRDPTAFQYLMPGVQENPANNGNVLDSSGNATTSATNGGSGIYGGSGATNLNENYVEGVPVSNISQQGSNTAISNSVSVDAVDQFSVQTNGASTAFGGAGATNYTIKAGGNQFHGTVFDFIRNTMFDTWGYFAKVPSANGFAEKPGEHQNSYGGSLGGPIFKDKLFFFGSYEGYHYTKISNTPQYITIPTLQERLGNFTDQLGTTQANIADSSVSETRPPFQGLLNGVPTYNVIPTSEISSITNYLQSALPTPTNLSTFQNYLAGLPLENNDYSVDARLDYTINARNKFSLVGLGGNQGFGSEPSYDRYTQLPIPYAGGVFTNKKTASGILTYTYIVSQTMINSLKYGYTRNWGEAFSLTQGTKWSSAAAGIQNLPPGGASDDFPQITWSQANGPLPPTEWYSDSSSGPGATNTYTVIDNLQWIKGRHNITFGAQIQWLETNAATYGGYSQASNFEFSSYNTETSTSTTTGGFNGDAYASFLIGAVYMSSVHAQAITDVGGRYRPMAPYIQDNWQVSPKLTLNLGFRYDYLQPYHEVKDRIAFLNVNLTNPIVGIPGVLEYAGFPNSSTPAAYVNYICHCTTPVHPYNKNFEPRLGFSYAANPSTVFNGGFGIQLTHAGGSGGGAGATAGTGNNGEYGATTGLNQTGSSNAPPAYFLNPSIQGSPTLADYDPPVQGTQPIVPVGLGPQIPCVAAGTCNPFSALPPWTPPGITVNPLQPTGDYNFGAVNTYSCITADQATCTPQPLNYADPYYGGRGPQFINYNVGMQRMINKKANLSINYAGSQTHFLPGGAGRGYATNTYSPDYDQLLQGTLEGTVNVTNLQAILPTYKLPYPGFTGPSATVAKSLAPFPQFSGLTDLWGDTGNSNYNSLQVSVIQRPWHNLSGFVNYTRSKEIDNTGHHRTQFPVGPQDGNFSKFIPANHVDRGLGQYNQTNAFNLTWVYAFPIGRGQAFGSTNRYVSLIGGGWQLSGIYKYRDGYPLQITNGAGCQSSSYGGQGTCMPDYTPGFNKNSARINGRWGRGPGATASNLNTIQYLNPAAFECPDSSPQNPVATCGTSGTEATWKLGNIARSAADGLTGPGWWDIDLGLRRTFNVRETATLHLTFQVEADVSNATNSTFFNLASAAWNNVAPTFSNPAPASTYGLVSGQNQSIVPRDWQFAGRFRF